MAGEEAARVVSLSHILEGLWVTERSVGLIFKVMGVILRALSRRVMWSDL